jgi:uncharacterized membrane protein
MKWLAAAVVVLAVLAELTLGRLARAPDLALFIGRFHPLVVHLPIGFFLLVALGEAVSFVPKLRERVEPALGLLLPVSAAAALAAFLMGQLLALEGGFPAASLSWHRRLTLIAVIGIAACWVVFERQRARGSGRWAYRGVLGATLGVLSLGAHFGGTMTRGEAYLSKYAPGPLKPLLGEPEAKPAPKEPAKPAAPAAEPLVYEHVVQPLLTKYCVECHGTEKQKGKLRLDSLAELMKGGENGAVVVAGDAGRSSIVARALLPISDDDHMPPEDKPQLAPEELAVIRFWIERGATPTLRVKDALAPAASRALLEHAAGAAPKADQLPTVAAPAVSASPSLSSDPIKADSPPAPATDAVPAPAPVPAPVSTEPAAVNASAPAPAPAQALSGPAFLATHCTKCHGAQKQKGKLRVDSVAALLKGGAEGPALVPGSPDESSIVQRVRLPLGSDDHMPPKKEPQPTPSEVAAFVAWVRAGAGGTSASAARPAAAPAPDAFSASASASDADAAAAVAVPVAAPPPPATAVAGPPDPSLLRDLPEHVALFADAIQPLFRDKCGKCHIRDSPAAGLAMGEHRQLLEGGYSGPGIVPKDRPASLIMARIVLPPSDDEHMPPEGEPQLNADEVELIGSWIDQGAPASGSLVTSALSAGAVRALSARGIKPAAPPPPALAAKSGGCAACSIPSGPAFESRFLQLQSAATLGLASLLLLRRRRRRRH